MAESNPTGQPEQEKRVVRIWDDPESRIHFLETVLKDKGWEAVIYHPDFAPDGAQKQDTTTPLPELERLLAARGYKTSLGHDENGIPILNVRNFGSDMSLGESVRELGFVKGMAHKINHIDEPLGNVMQKTADMVKHVATDKARLIGGLYLVGDLFLIVAGLFNKEEKKQGNSKHGLGALKDPANMLQSMAGIMATAQSLIYMGYAKKGSEAMYSDLMKQAKTAKEQGKDLLDAETWQGKGPDGPKGLLALPQKLLKSYPIQLGALAQISGQLSLIASGGIRLQRSKVLTGEDAAKMRQGGIQDMLTGAMSSIGWSLLTKTKPEKIAEEDKYPWSDPRRVWQEMSENPNQFASGFLGAATLSGIAAGRAKSNNAQILANLTYLAGDGIMFLTKSEHYGAEGAGNSAMLAEAAEQFVNASPVILGQKEQGQLVQQLSGYLAERFLHQEAKKTKRTAPVSEQEIKELGGRIAADLNAKLPLVNTRANEAAACIAGLVKTFHPSVGEKITDALCEAVSEMQGVAIDKEELKAHVVRQTEYPKEAPTKIVKMDDIAKPMADLLFAIPGAANPESVDKLYSAVDEYVRPEPFKGKERLESAINQTAMQDITYVMHPHREAPVASQSAPVMGAHTAALARQQQMQGVDVSR